MAASEGERRLGFHEGVAVVREAVARGAIQLREVHAFVSRVSFASPLSRSQFEQRAAVEAAIRRGLVVVVELPRVLAKFGHEYPRGDIGVTPRIHEAPLAGPDKSLLISRCDAELREGPLKFTYLLRELAGEPVELRIHATGLSDSVVHRRSLGPAETLDGAHDAEWDGRVTVPGPLFDYRLPANYSPCTVELYADTTYRDDAPFSIADPKVTIALRFIEVGGRPVAGLPIELETADGSVREGATNGAGELQFASVQPGPCQVRIVAVKDIDWDDDIDSGSDRVPPADDERTVDVSLDLEAPTSSAIDVDTGAANCVILERPILRPLIPDFLRCDHDSALLVPAPWTDERHPLAGVVHALVGLLDQPDRWLLVVGHASAPGKKTRNQTLSEHRADVIRAIVESDDAAWVGHARERGSLRDVMAYLDYLGRQRGWLCGAQSPVDDLTTNETAETRDSVSAFQAEYNARFEGTLETDGVCGNKTLAAIFEVLYDEFERWLAKLGASPEALPLDRVVYAGYGATLAGREGQGPQAEAADRIVDLILVEHLPLAKDIDLAQVYDSAIARRLPFEVPCEPDEWATGPLTIVSDLTPEEPAEPETYRLRSEDGSWSSERILPEDAVVESGEFVLRFEALPTEHRYTLIVVASDGGESVIFANLAYGALHGATPDLS